MTEFEGVAPALGHALSQRGYETLTPVQAAVLAPGLGAADLLVSAQTGSGKTVAFGLAIEPTLLAGAGRFAAAAAPLALAVAPTRELALQVKRELDWLYAETGARVASCVGGMDMRAERRALEAGAHLVVGTPGRLRDHIERGALDMTALRAVILDEADEMLDLGFRDDLEYILDAAPAERRTLMFSATVPHAIAALARRYQKDAVRISTAEERAQHVDIDYRVYTVAPNDRENGIINVLRFYEAQSALVFCGTRMMVNHMTSRFANRGFSVVALSGELSQNERNHALQAMRDGRVRVCIATDVAARGLDLPNLDLVIHADIPKTRESLLHRSGRTGRAGRKGVCALIVPLNARRQAERLLSAARIQATWARSPSIDEVAQRDRERLFEDPILAEPLAEDEAAFARDLLARYGAERVAAAFLRQHRTAHPAAEELIDTAPAVEPPKRRDDFRQGVWFALSVGSKDGAEPRWLLPMLCRAGHITKNEIGAIRVHDDETHVELAAACVERFLAAVGPARTMEETITLRPLDGPPGAPSAPAARPPRAGPPDADQKAPAGKKPWAKKAWAKKDPGRKPFAGRRADPAADGDDAPSRAPFGKKKPFRKAGAADRKPAEPAARADSPRRDGPAARPGHAKAGGKGRWADTRGAAPLKRKKPRNKPE